MSNRYNQQFTLSPHNKATILDCNFIVDQTNGNGLGIRSLKPSGRIASVFMNTNPSATTATSVFGSGATIIGMSSLTNLVVGMAVTDSTTSGNIQSGTVISNINPINNTITLSKATAGASASSPGDTLSFAMTAALAGNPNPAAGVIIVNLQDNYNRYLGGYAGFVSPLSGSSISISGSSVLTIGQVYVIVSLGSSTQANWVAAGLSPNVQAAVGVSFVAQITGGGTGTGAVQALATAGSGIDHIEVCGDPNLMNNANGINVLGQGNGMQIIMQCFSEGTVTAPANGTVIGLNFYMNDSAQGV